METASSLSLAHVKVLPRGGVFPFPRHDFLHPKLARRGVGTIMEEEEEAVVKAEHVACCRRQWVSLGAQLHYCQVFGNIVDTFRLHRA